MALRLKLVLQCVLHHTLNVPHPTLKKVEEISNGWTSAAKALVSSLQQ
jgi:hypothetical protein